MVVIWKYAGFTIFVKIKMFKNYEKNFFDCCFSYCACGRGVL